VERAGPARDLQAKMPVLLPVIVWVLRGQAGVEGADWWRLSTSSSGDFSTNGKEVMMKAFVQYGRCVLSLLATLAFGTGDN
jgi:hypothetical protein